MALGGFALTPISDLAGVASGAPVAVIGEGRSDFAEAFEGGAPSRAFIFGESDLLLLARLGILERRRDRDDLVVKPTRLLRPLRTLVRFRGVPVLRFSRDVEVLPDVLRRLSHRLQAILGFLAFHDGRVEGSGATPLFGLAHRLGANRDTDIDASHADLVGDVLHGLQSGRAEAVDGGGGGGVGEASGQRCGADHVGCSRMTDLSTLLVSLGCGPRCWYLGAYISDTDVFHHLRVDP